MIDVPIPLISWAKSNPMQPMCLRILLAFLVSWAIAIAGAPQKNIVLLLADDLGWSDLGCYGNDLHETPNLDRLASQGIRFTDAYAASPVCSPTRAAILTGKHPARLHMTIWREAARERGRRQLLEPVCIDSLPLEHTTLAETLKEAGYFNAHIGKWHLGRAEAYPQPHGFHVNIGGTLWGAPQSFWHPYNGDAYFRDWRYVPDLEPGKTGDYLTDRLTEKGIQVMEQQVRVGRPFFLNLWYHTVHTPIEGKPQLVDDYKKKIRPESKWKNPHYAAMVHSLDENVGRILTKIKDLGISDNTLVVFTSDNGGFVNRCKLHKELQVANNSPLRSGKGSCYEGGIRVPLIVSGPGLAKGMESSTPVYSCDLLPTLLHAAGQKDKTPEGLDGMDLTPLLKKPGASLPRDTLYFHYPHYYPTTSPVSAIRKGNWKLLEYFTDGHLELYNLKNDPGEKNNLVKTHSNTANELALKLHLWRKRVDALEPEPNPAWKPRK
jgi:arylsulfatase A